MYISGELGKVKDKKKSSNRYNHLSNGPIVMNKRSNKTDAGFDSDGKVDCSQHDLIFRSLWAGSLPTRGDLGI
jgi:hypothetical protein